MRWNMKKLCLLITACLFLLVGCNVNADPLAYQRGNISCEVSFSVGAVAYEANLLLGAIREDGGRDATLTLNYPENLRGVCVKRLSDGAYLSFGEVEIPLPAASLSGFFEVADAFSINGNIEKIEVEGNSNIISVLSDAGRYRVYLDSATHTPEKIDFEGTTRTIEINIKNFNK